MEVEKGNKEKETRSSKLGFELVIRVFALVLTLVAAIVLGIAKQTKLVSVQIIPTLPPVQISTTAKASYLSAFMYDVSVNAIACGYTVISIAILLMNKNNKNKKLAMVVLLGDLIMVGLLFSGTGAAGSIGLMGLQGNKHVRWKKVCGVFGKFCHQNAAAVFISLIASIVYMLLVVLDAIKLP